MRFFKVEMEGKLINQKVASLPAWTSDDEGRIVYDETTNEMYVGDDSGWVSSSPIPTGVSMWFYENSVPDGWTIVAAVGDELLAVKGGATYTAGGVAAGTWTQPNHSHGDGTLSVGNHNHQWYEYDGGDLSLSWASNGSSQIDLTQDNDGVASTRGLLCRVYNANSNRYGLDLYTEDSTAGVTGDTGNAATANTYRPDARVGILCTKN